ncbi:MAG: hypothetical protein K8R53_05150 [Bacteroidales bacterium]|nr:hypothetical protein [Bacteroidales bacterium]
MEEASEKLLSEKTKNLIAILEADSENEKTQKQISRLEKDNEIHELKMAQSRNLNIGTGTLFVILVIMGLLFIRQNKLKNEHKSTLLE